MEKGGSSCWPIFKSSDSDCVFSIFNYSAYQFYVHFFMKNFCYHKYHLFDESFLWFYGFFKYIFSFSSYNTFKIVDTLVRVKFRLPWGGFCLIFAYNLFFLLMPHHFEYCNVAALEPRLHSLYSVFLL